MEDALIYFLVMAALMIPLSVVHMMCRHIVKKAPSLMPDKEQRDHYRWGELTMAFTCLAMVFYMWMILDYMITFCATMPLLGAVAHMPWILGTAAVLVTKTMHLMRLRIQMYEDVR